MSYEGYDQLLCENGHYSTEHPYHYGIQYCAICGAQIVWQFCVDQTNGCEHDEEEHRDDCCGIPLSEFPIREPEQSHDCSECGTHIVKRAATYHPPPGKGARIPLEIH